MLSHFPNSSSYKNCNWETNKKAQTTEIEECIIEDKKFSNLEEKKKFSYENKVKTGSIQNIVLSKTLQTTVKARGITKKTIINMIGIFE